MVIRITYFIATTIFFILMSYDMRDIEPKSGLGQLFKFLLQFFAASILAILTTVFLVSSLSQSKTQESFKKIDTTNVTVTLTQGKKSLPLTDQTRTKDLKTISKGDVVLSDGQTTAKRSFDTIDITKSGDIIDHLKYGTKITYDSYFGDQLDKSSQKVLRVVLKPNAVDKRFN